jgi:hypothetical protein
VINNIDKAIGKLNKREKRPRLLKLEAKKEILQQKPLRSRGSLEIISNIYIPKN